MPTYRWTCLACGNANAAEDEACADCACSATPTSARILSSRHEFLQRGGVLQGEAAMTAQPDLSGFEVLGKPLLYLLAVFGLFF